MGKHVRSSKQFDRKKSPVLKCSAGPVRAADEPDFSKYFRASVSHRAIASYCKLVTLTVTVIAVTLCAADSQWQPIPLLTSPQKEAGISPGGEGGQWPRGPVATSPADPDFLLLPIDVGGVYRSLDGGEHWHVAMNGWNSRGANAFAIDPRTADRVLGVGGNSMNWNKAWGQSPNGLYVSTDKATSWKQVLTRLDGIGGAVAWDSSQHDSHGSTRAYYLTANGDLFRSDDAGASWSRISRTVATTPVNDWTAGGSIPTELAVDRHGSVWIGGNEGLFRSDDHGQHFHSLQHRKVSSLCAAADQSIYLGTTDGVLTSRDDGKSFQPLSGKGLKLGNNSAVCGLTVSPVEPKNLLCWIAQPGFDWPRYVSHDGGDSWQTVSINHNGEALPCNARQGYATWSARDAQVAWSLGGDWVTKSINGGKTFGWSNNGYNGIMLGGLFNFNSLHPKTMFLGFQDYNGAFTTDDGQTWNPCDVSGKGWGGHQYGAFALSDQVMWAGDAESWGSPRHLRLTRDGGRTWAFANQPDGKPIELSRTDVGCGDPSDANVGFSANYRTIDDGQTWQRMDGCDGVYTADEHSLLGAKQSSVVRSKDHGQTWDVITTVSGGVDDLASDPGRHLIYAASQGLLKVCDGQNWRTIDTPADQYGKKKVQTVAVDPNNPAILYIGGPSNIYASAATVCRSVDSGKSWTNLTAGAGGPHEVSAIRVNSNTRQTWAAGECFGMWKIDPPSSGDPAGRPARDAAAARQGLVPSGD